MPLGLVWYVVGGGAGGRGTVWDGGLGLHLAVFHHVVVLWLNFGNTVIACRG